MNDDVRRHRRCCPVRSELVAADRKYRYDPVKVQWRNDALDSARSIASI